MRALGDLIGLARSQPNLVRRAPCQEVVLTGDEVDLFAMPIITCWPLDAAPFITLPLVITRDPESDRRNVGMYRMQVYDKKTTGMHWQTHKVGARHDRRAQDRGIERLEVAVAIGVDPTTMWTGSMPLPPDMDEFAVSGVIRGEPVDLVKCKTVDLEVPAPVGVCTRGIRDSRRNHGRRAFRRPHRLLLPCRALPCVPRYGDDESSRPYLRYHDGRASALGRLLHGQGDGADHASALQMTLPEIVDMNMPAEGISTTL